MGGVATANIARMRILWQLQRKINFEDLGYDSTGLGDSPQQSKGSIWKNDSTRIKHASATTPTGN